MWYYKFSNILPEVPEHFINEAREFLSNSPEKNKMDKVRNVGANAFYHHSVRHPESGNDVPSCRLPQWELGDNFTNWVKENIVDWAELQEARVSPCIGNSDIAGPHTDATRIVNALYIFDLDSDDIVTRFWQEKNKPIIRKLKYRTLDSFENLTLLDEVIIPKNTWTVIRTDVLHSVHNISGRRNAFHISLKSDPFEGLKG
jgi:hypothetical protein